MKKTLFGLCAATAVAFGGSADAAIFINEIHYDNAGGDVGEFVEIVTTASEDASLIVLSLYNGSDSELYGSNDTFTVSSDFTDHGVLADGFNYYSILISGIQNGSPDGLAVSFDGTVQEFFSYEGTIAAAGDGPAVGLASTDIGVSETSSTPIGSSLQRIDFGSTWALTEETNTRGAINVIPEPASLALVGLGGLVMLGRGRRQA
ncbi:MAG: PEP-CTERM sorting domain-containing protein [Planctomycetota bacterium]